MFMFLAPDLSQAIQPIYDILSIVTPIMLGLVFAIGTPYCITIGVKMAKAEEAQAREEAKRKLLWSVGGFLLVFVLIGILYLAQDPLMQWISDITDNQISSYFPNMV